MSLLDDQSSFSYILSKNVPIGKKKDLIKDILKYYYRIKILNNTPILIYQMGKVGSKSIYQSLTDYGIKSIFHEHLMSFENINKINNKYIEFCKKNNLKQIHPPIHWIGRKLKKNIIDTDKNIKIITLVRDPIARNVSSFFQNLKIYVNHNNINEISIDILRDLFVNEFDRHDRPLHWFDDELKTTTGFDIYSTTFPKKKGFKIIRMKNIDLLILKLEIDDRAKESAIIQFLELNLDFKLKRANVADKKNYSKLYNNFKKELNLPKEYIKRLLNSKYSKHFYSSDELIKIKKKWS